MKLITLIGIITVLLLPLMLMTNCKPPESKNIIKDEYQQIKKILDKAMSSDNPLQKFHQELPRIQKFSTVDSAWVTNIAFFVRFREGGTVSWILDAKDLRKP
ncbi:MAG: hypothetical protein NTW31_04530 [Bacteroidetes bacterium]|nr:hypothetical protein [Bacteroidota bacterium]